MSTASLSLPGQGGVARRGPSVAAAVAFALRLGLGLTFLVSAAAKLRDPWNFLSDVYSYQIVGARAGLVLAATLPAVELLVAACLLVNVWARGAACLASALLVGFAAAQGWALWRGLSIACGCFGNASTESVVSYRTLLRTTVLALGAVATVLLDARLRAAREPLHAA